MVEIFIAFEAALVVTGLAAWRIAKRIETIFVLVVFGMTGDAGTLRFDLGALFGVAVVAFDLAMCPRELETGSSRMIELELFELALFG